MRVGLLSPSIYMSPTKYGEMIFAPRQLAIDLADGLVARGNEVHFYTTSDTLTRAILEKGDDRLLFRDLEIKKLKEVGSERMKWASFYGTKHTFELELTMRAYAAGLAGKLDIIHSYHNTLAHFFEEATGVPTVYTLHDPVPGETDSLDGWLLTRFAHQRYIAISENFRRHDPLGVNFVGTVHHGIDLSRFAPSFREGSYLAFAGRMVPEKGVDVAIAVARSVGQPLRLATSGASENQKASYYQETIAPLVEGNAIRFTGFLADKEKAAFLGRASCLLFPIRWEEPFGMVMIEAMACGTPVVAYNRGSVAEIVIDGKTGFIVDEKDGVVGLVAAIKRLGEIDRTDCRRHVEDHFTVSHMAQGYEEVYQKVLSR